MIKKVTIALVCLLVLAVGTAVLFDRGVLKSPSSGVPSVTDGSNNRSGWNYDITDDHITLVGYTGKDSNPQIPEEIDGIPVTTLGEGLFANNTRIKEVIIPSSVTKLGNGIFENCTGLTLVTLPQTIERIPSKTFSGCTGLTVIQIPNSVTNIASNAFAGCTGLTYLTIPDSVRTIGDEAFLNCEKLSQLDISRNLRNLGTHAFKGTPWLASQTETFNMIGDHILIRYIGNEETVEVPMGVTSITDAFEDNMFPLEIILPDSLTSIGPHAFSGCRSLETINIPASVRSIGDSAFRGCSHLTAITLPDSLNSIGASAFQSCSSLERIIIPYGVTGLPALSFANCEKLRSVQIPETVQSISDNALVFSGVSELRVVRGSVAETFAQQNGYSYIYQQQSTGDFIFQQTEEGVQIVLYVGGLYDVVIPERISGENVTSISDILFQHNSYVRSVTLPKTITGIADYSFANMSDLRTVTLPDTLTSIGIGAFQNDVMLGDLEIPESVEEIADDAFAGCPSLIIIAKEGSYAFEWAMNAGIRVKDKNQADTSNFSFVQPAGLTLIYSYDGDESSPELPRINEYGENISGITDEAFRGRELSSVEIPEGYETLGNYVFADDPVKLEITIPRSVISIGENCFEGTDVTIHGYNGSYAESYAREHGIKFLVIADWEL